MHCPISVGYTLPSYLGVSLSQRLDWSSLCALRPCWSVEKMTRYECENSAAKKTEAPRSIIIIFGKQGSSFRAQTSRKLPLSWPPQGSETRLLSSYLSSRKGVWRCPVCGKDAKPWRRWNSAEWKHNGSLSTSPHNQAGRPRPRRLASVPPGPRW